MFMYRYAAFFVFALLSTVEGMQRDFCQRGQLEARTKEKVVPSLLELTMKKIESLDLAEITADVLFRMPDHLRMRLVRFHMIKQMAQCTVVPPGAFRLRATSIMRHAISKEGNVALGAYSGVVCILKDPVIRCKEHRGCIWDLLFTEEGKLISCSDEGRICAWENSGYRLMSYKSSPARSFITLSLTHDNNIIAGARDGLVILIDLEGKLLASCKGHTGSVLTLCSTKDDLIISGSSDHEVRVWRKNGDLLFCYRQHAFPVTAICLTEDETILSGDDVGTVCVWNKLGATRAQQSMHRGRVVSLVRSEANCITSIARDGTFATILIDSLSCNFLYNAGDKTTAFIGEPFVTSSNKGLHIWLGKQCIATLQGLHAKEIEAISCFQNKVYVRFNHGDFGILSLEPLFKILFPDYEQALKIILYLQKNQRLSTWWDLFAHCLN